MKTRTWVLPIIALLIGVFTINIFWIVGPLKVETINLANASTYATFLGGYVGVLLTFISTILLVITLKNQIDINDIQKFETKYFELIRLHRDNVIEISIGQSNGRKVFVKLIREYREIFEHIKQLDYIQEKAIELKDIINIAYLVLFYGTGPNSTRMLLSSLKKYDKELVTKIIDDFSSTEFKSQIKEKRKFNYIPFEGHQSRLGHYYRHLYQSFCYIDKQKCLKNSKERYEYAKILRAQLSTHEQALLALNILSDLGTVWTKKGKKMKMTELLLINIR